ncbi:Pentatricopeptide repeat-containing protein [Forsythia ovata]|uniref:Pentatricopeptide repeat-containing protein n=1 Tax=Forsythia ovata TaxID=205694 RepID=A0ABD1T8P2_9LAMI
MAIATISTTTGTPILTTQIQVQPVPISTNPNSKSGSLKSCKNLQEIKQLHAHITKQGLLHTSTTLTKLIAKYSQVGSLESLEYAQKAFKIFKDDEENSYSNVIYLYNCLIKGNSLVGFLSEAILLHVEMMIEGVEPDTYTLPFVLSACAKSLRLFEGIQVHASIVKMGIQDDIFISNSLIHFYGECGEIDEAKRVFDKMHERNVVSWTSLICGYARMDQPKEAVSLFFEMVREGIWPNEVTVVCVISACAKLGDLDLGKSVCAHIQESRLTFNAVMVNALVDMYIKCGDIEMAKHLFDDCTDKNLVLYNTILSNYVRLGKAKEALDIFCELLDRGSQPDRVTMLSAIAASAELGNFCFGKQCHAHVFRNGLESWDNIGNAIIDMYTKCGKQEWACKVFNRMPNKTIVSWNSLIAGYVRNGDVESAQSMFYEMPERNLVSWNTMIRALVQESCFNDAIELFRRMHNEGVRADRVTMMSVASACGYLGALDLAKWTYTYIRKHGIQCDMRLSTALVDMFARCGNTQSAMEVFDTMKKRDVSSWTAAIGAMAMEGNGERAVKLFHEMLRQGVKPDEVVFVGVLAACSHAGLVDQGMEIFRNMKGSHGITPQIVHYGCVVDLLGRAGSLDEALDIIKCMPMEPSDVIWGALLAACRIHKNEKITTQALERLSESAKGKTGIQVLLSNIYASAGKWSDVANVRVHMKEKGLRKVPGSSSIEVNGVVHEFTSDDKSHPEKAITDSMLQETNCRLRDLGYVPDLTNVLQDIDEQEKEFLLSRHSEKQAIAFGLICSDHGMPVRVVKNLRMCSDCHSFAKMVSQVYNREIIVRDNNRFHFFRQGLCSCHDYW